MVVFKKSLDIQIFAFLSKMFKLLQNLFFKKNVKIFSVMSLITNYTPLMQADSFYHIFNRANSNHDVLFTSAENYRFFLIKFATYLSPYIKIYAYCLLPNHFHFLIQVKSEELFERM